MNTFSWILIVMLGSACICGYTLLLLQSIRQHKQITDLQTQLDVFVDTSINVARSVDRLVHNGGSDKLVNVASRRWILQEAKSRLNSGESLLDIAAPLGLSKDEVRLLNMQLH